MKRAMLLSLVGVVAMGVVLIYAFTTGDFSAEGRELLSMPWGIVSLVDLYVGFFLFAGWILYREQSHRRAAVWIVLLMLLGFFIGSLYALLALYTSKGDWHLFWQGKQGPTAAELSPPAGS
jgi:O-antigen/teichoic acid export membrane protein